MSDQPWFRHAIDGGLDEEALRARGAAQITRVRERIASATKEDKTLPADVEYISTRAAVAEWIEEEQRGPEYDTSTGWPDLDALLGKPMRHSEVILMAARTGVGKTWAIQGMLENALESKPDLYVLLNQLEMPAFHMAERLVTHALNIAPGGVRRRAKLGLTVDEVMEAAPDLDRLGMTEQAISVQQIPAAMDAMEAATGHRPGIVAVDYLGLLRGAGRSRYEVASDISRGLKEIANQEKVLIIAAAQLSREAGDGSRRPTLDALRDSGVAEEAADRVLGLWRPDHIEDGEASITDGVELGIVVLKNRFGPAGGETRLEYDHTLRLRQSTNDGIPW